MEALLPAPVEARTTPSVLMDGAQASRFDLKPVGCTKENGTPLARTAASPRLCHAPMASPCCTPIDDSLTICFTRARSRGLRCRLIQHGDLWAAIHEEEP